LLKATLGELDNLLENDST